MRAIAIQAPPHRRVEAGLFAAESERMQDRLSANLGAILFDLDGTLLDTEAQIAAALVETLAERGYVVAPELVRAATGLPLRGWLVSSLGMSAEQAEAAYAAYLERTMETYVRLARPMPNAEQLLREIEVRGIPLAIVTTRLNVVATALLANAGWSNRFDVVVTQETASRPKPAGDPAEFALRALGVGPERAAMVGNTEADMACGRAAGLSMVIGFVGERSAEALLAAGATHLCGSLGEVAALILG